MQQFFPRCSLNIRNALYKQRNRMQGITNNIPVFWLISLKYKNALATYVVYVMVTILVKYRWL